MLMGPQPFVGVFPPSPSTPEPIPNHHPTAHSEMLAPGCDSSALSPSTSNFLSNSCELMKVPYMILTSILESLVGTTSTNQDPALPTCGLSPSSSAPHPSPLVFPVQHSEVALLSPSGGGLWTNPGSPLSAEKAFSAQRYAPLSDENPREPWIQRHRSSMKKKKEKGSCKGLMRGASKAATCTRPRDTRQTEAETCPSPRDSLTTVCPRWHHQNCHSLTQAVECSSLT